MRTGVHVQVCKALRVWCFEIIVPQSLSDQRSRWDALHCMLRASFRCRIAELAVAEGKAVVLVINKWDLVEDRSQEAMKQAEENVKGNLRHVSWAKCVFTSATQGVLASSVQ